MPVNEIMVADPVVTVVHASGCHYCDDARVGLEELAREHPTRVDDFAAASPEGLRLLAAHRAPMFPLVLLDGEFFSSGRLPRGKLRIRLDQRHRAGSR